ncbi:TetR/AcrR family transcriptional regulator [Rhodopirellula bahusiensis]|uniref:TetR/AcrR family transcriptional regulator n=1 Tax=Rhodopirellula bahusiensis TaxID=2014065 RepID=UPI0032647F0E
MNPATIEETTAKLTPKQIEIQQRESRILDKAFPMLRSGGVAAISMNAIAKEMGCTRGTIYNHFANKEEILLALATRAVRRRIALFQCAMESQTMPRDQCAAVGIAVEVYADYMPDEFAIEQIIRHDVVWQKTSAGRRDVLSDCEQLCIASLGRLVQSAISAGDLKPARGQTASELSQQLVFGLWSLTYGGLVLEATSPSLIAAGIEDARLTIRRNGNLLLDGVGWQPLFNARRYNAWAKRLRPTLIENAKTIRQLPCTSEKDFSHAPESAS